ncbi:MAG: hypothetical protein ACLQOO_13540 [Terriglobia bacterium]
MFLVSVQRQRHERWRTRLVEVLGAGPGSPGDVRRKIERRLFAFGATKAARTYPRPTKLDCLADDFQATVGEILAGAVQNAATSPEPARAGPEPKPRAGKGLEGQNKANSKP